MEIWFGGMKVKRKLVLENGMSWMGEAFGSTDEKVAELVFNTSMVGYQEILSDPSYCNQLVCMTYPLIGNYGLADEDYEAKKIYMAGMIVREYNDEPSNFRFTRTLGEVMEENHVVGISEIDTRMLCGILREHGSMKALICDVGKPMEECMSILKNFNYPTNQVAQVSSKRIWYSRTSNPLYTVVAVDCGIKLNMIRKFNSFGCNVIVVPYDIKEDELLKFHPDGLFISNGPGDPSQVSSVIELIQRVRGKIPILGICLGHQLIGLAYGAKVYKMKFGHRGGNHPVLNLKTGKVEITSQNHSYAIEKSSISNTELELTHINLLDQEAEGVMDSKHQVIGVQYHPESACGPEDSNYIFQSFLNMMKERKTKDAQKKRY